MLESARLNGKENVPRFRTPFDEMETTSGSSRRASIHPEPFFEEEVLIFDLASISFSHVWGDGLEDEATPLVLFKKEHVQCSAERG